MVTVMAVTHTAVTRKAVTSKAVTHTAVTVAMAMDMDMASSNMESLGSTRGMASRSGSDDFESWLRLYIYLDSSFANYSKFHK